jgi:integrase
VQYRTPEGRHRRTVLGRYGIMTAEQARQAAWDILSAFAKGIDPAAAPEPDRNAITVSVLCDWYLAEAEAGRILGRRRRLIKASTLAMDRSRIEAHIRPLLGARQVGALTLGDIEGAQADIAAGKTAKPRAGSRSGATTGGEGVSARTISTLHAVFEHVVRLGKIETTPGKGVRRPASTPRDRRLSRAEIAKLGKAMRAAETAGEHPTGLAAIRLLLLTGFRRLEGLALRREWLNVEEAAIRFPTPRAAPSSA